MEKKKKNKIIIVFIIIILLFDIGITFLYLNRKQDNTEQKNSTPENIIEDEPEYKIGEVYQFDDVLYKIPEGFTFEETDAGLFKAIHDNWNASIGRQDNKQGNSINTIYESYSKDADKYKMIVHKEKLENIETVIVEQKEEKIIFCYFIFNNELFNIIVYYKDDTFDLNELNPLINSLINPIK